MIHDPDTSLYRIGARWYDPDVGLWLTPDSIVPNIYKPIAWNPYAFNYNNPVNYVDPSGHFPCGGLCIAAVVGIGTIAGSGYAWSRGYGPDTWQFYASAAMGGATAGLGLGVAMAEWGLAGTALGLGVDTLGGATADAAIFGDPFGPALAQNAAANLLLAGAGYGLGRGANAFLSSKFYRNSYIALRFNVRWGAFLSKLGLITAESTSTLSNKFWHVKYLQKPQMVEGDARGKEIYHRPDPG